MSNTFTPAGAQLWISAAAPATHNEAGFAALTYTEVKEVVDLGEGFAKAWNTAQYSPLANPETQTRKSSYTSGDVTVQYAVDFSDPGQDLMRDAADSYNLYSFKVVLPAIAGVTIYGQALVMSAAINLGSIDNIVQTSTQLAFQNGGIIIA